MQCNHELGGNQGDGVGDEVPLVNLLCEGALHLKKVPYSKHLPPLLHLKNCASGYGHVTVFNFFLPSHSYGSKTNFDC